MNDNIETIYFFCASYGVTGGANYVISLIQYLVDNTQYQVGVIDFKDGYIIENLADIRDKIEFIDYQENIWDISNNSVIFVPAERLCLMKPILRDVENVKFITILWETTIGWDLLYPKNILKKLSALLYATNSLMFIDLGCQVACEKQLNRQFKENYLPLYLPQNENSCIAKQEIVQTNVYNIAWLGRLSDAKCYSLLNLIKQYSKIITDKKKIIHIIGNGLHEKELKKEIAKLSLENLEIIFVGRLVGDALSQYLNKNVDVLFAMGTSLLNGASLNLPSVGVSETANPELNLNEFIWLFEEKGLQLGLPDSKKLIEQINPSATSLGNILNEIYTHNKKKEIGQKCYSYYKENYSDLSNIIKKLLKAIIKSQLTYNHIQRIFRSLPFIKQRYFEATLLGIPIFKKIVRTNRIYIYFLGIKMLKIIKSYRSEKWKLFCLFTIMRTRTVGKYNFPNIFSKKLK